MPGASQMSMPLVRASTAAALPTRLYQVDVPGAGLQCADRPCGAVDADADALRAVCRHDIRDAIFHQVAMPPVFATPVFGWPPIILISCSSVSWSKELVHRRLALIDVQQHDLFVFFRIFAGRVHSNCFCTHCGGRDSGRRPGFGSLCNRDVVNVRVFILYRTSKLQDAMALRQRNGDRAHILKVCTIRWRRRRRRSAER